MSMVTTILIWSGNVQASAVGVTHFTAIENAVFVDVPSGNVLPPIVSGGLIITHTPNFVVGGFASFAIGGPDDPSTGDGYSSMKFGAVPVEFVTLNFSIPLAAFGVTFQHIGGSADPALLSAFDGPNGTGNLIGSIQTTGWLGGGSHPDFVAVWSDAINVRSAVLTGTGPSYRILVDAYGYSLTPVPEPSSFALMVAGMAVACWLRHWVRG
jgi:hypothetical protein